MILWLVMGGIGYGKKHLDANCFKVLNRMENACIVRQWGLMKH